MAAQALTQVDLNALIDLETTENLVTVPYHDIFNHDSLPTPLLRGSLLLDLEMSIRTVRHSIKAQTIDQRSPVSILLEASMLWP
jgi:hypothetical protein